VMQRLIPRPDAVLDPFEVGERSLDVLRQELTALNRQRLLNIIAAFDLAGGDPAVARMTERELIGLIVGAVETRLSSARRR